MTDDELARITYTQELAEVNAKLDAILAALKITPPVPVPPAPPAPPVPPTTLQAVYWVNQSQGDLTDADAAKIVTALNVQAAHLVELWPSVSPVAHALWTGNPDAIPAEAWPMYWLPDADTAGALGYHDTVNGPQGPRPFGRVFTRYNGTAWPALQPGLDGISISNISSHEGTELQVDPPCTTTDTAPDGKVWAREVADPVEAFAYDVTLPDGSVVSLSDFVTAAFFGLPDASDSGLDAMGKVQTPFTIAPGGYALIDGAQVFADKPSLRFLSQQGSPAGRTYRRLHQ